MFGTPDLSNLKLADSLILISIIVIIISILIMIFLKDSLYRSLLFTLIMIYSIGCCILVCIRPDLEKNLKLQSSEKNIQDAINKNYYDVIDFKFNEIKNQSSIAGSFKSNEYIYRFHVNDNILYIHCINNNEISDAVIYGENY